jgi:hypothetical protein
VDEIKQDLKAIRSDLCDLKRDVAVNTVSLSDHMKRSDTSERRLEKVETWTLGLLSAILLAILGVMIKLLIE